MFKATINQQGLCRNSHGIGNGKTLAMARQKLCTETAMAMAQWLEHSLATICCSAILK